MQPTSVELKALISLRQAMWSSTESQDRASIFTPRASNSPCSLAASPSSVVHTAKEKRRILFARMMLVGADEGSKSRVGIGSSRRQRLRLRRH